MGSNDYHAIMTEITSNLTGDLDADRAYLMEKSEEYKTHEMAKEILRGIGRIMYELLPEDKKEGLEQAMKKDALGWQATLEEIDFCVFKRDFVKARTLIESLIDKLEEIGMYEDDEVSEYKEFFEPFEEILYQFRNKPEKAVRVPGFPYASLYTKYGSILFELKEHEKAKAALQSDRRFGIILRDIETGTQELLQTGNNGKMLQEPSILFLRE